MTAELAPRLRRASLDRTFGSELDLLLREAADRIEELEAEVMGASGKSVSVLRRSFRPSRVGPTVIGVLAPTTTDQHFSDHSAPASAPMTRRASAADRGGGNETAP